MLVCRASGVTMHFLIAVAGVGAQPLQCAGAACLTQD